MIDLVRAELADLLPLVVREASFEDPNLTLSGDGWSLNSVASWRVTRRGILVYGWSDPSAPDLIWDLCGKSIVSIAPQSQVMRGDPAFEFSSGEWLEIFSDDAVDPWTLLLPTRTFVGSPSDERFAG
jgi:hypothetical protein